LKSGAAGSYNHRAVGKDRRDLTRDETRGTSLMTSGGDLIHLKARSNRSKKMRSKKGFRTWEPPGPFGWQGWLREVHVSRAERYL